jgi:hypothetical protein
MNAAARLASLREEIEAIHFANKLYWDQEHHSQVATAEYERRQERLEEIRKEIQELQER